MTPDYYQPKMTKTSRAPTHRVSAMDQNGQLREVRIVGEFPLTLNVDGREVVTLMTLGTHIEKLALGFLRNQRLIENIEQIRSVEVDWETEAVNIATRSGKGIIDWQERLTGRTVTSGCGQGTVFSCTIDKLYEQRLSPPQLKQSAIIKLMKSVSKHNRVYREAGAVHGCGLCRGTEVLIFVEDVGRHNAADTISGHMWLERIPGKDKIFYTTGRLTSEIIMKAACMEIPVLLSRSGITHMALEMAQDLGIMIIARAKGNRFLVYHGQESIIFD
jgi:FdhD protein